MGRGMSGRVVVFMRWDVWQSCPQDEWRAWLRHHDLEPSRIPIGACISVSEPDHRVTISHYRPPDEDGSVAGERVVQCEGRVMPWPQIGGHHAADPFAPAPATLA